MKSNFKPVISAIIGCLAGLSLFSQISTEISVYPFKQGTRADSLATTTTRVKALLESRQFFEKTYLRKKLVFVAVDSKPEMGFSNKPWLQLPEIQQLKPSCASCLANYNATNKKLKQVIKLENARIKKENKAKLQRMRDSPGIQEGLTKLSNTNDYEILLSPREIFHKTDLADPRKSLVADSIKNLAEQILLGKPHNIDGYVNSINYQAIDFSNLKMPDLIENIISENLQLWKRIMTNTIYFGKISDTKISYRNFDGSSKLWVNTNKAQKTIFLSPYLLRAVFNMSLYQSNLFRLAEEIAEHGDDLNVYFGGKTGASAKQIDSAYFSNFVERFSGNIFFVIGHELAHIYLAGRTLNCDIETACDSYSAYFYLSHFKQIDLGVFENLLIKSIASNELDFWGNAINKFALQERYSHLLALKQSKDINKIACKIDLD